ncbi:hypothetical protein Efla_005249 [Eimeria flavescens]
MVSVFIPSELLLPRRYSTVQNEKGIFQNLNPCAHLGGLVGAERRKTHKAGKMQQVGKMKSATQAAAAPLVQKASDGVRALLKLVSSSESGYFKEGDVQAAEIRQQLSSPNTETKLTGLRRAIAAEAACGTGEFAEGPSLFFADVLKNLSTADFELKRLVYLYLVQHAQEHPDLTLLSINGYQKDLYCSSHVVRAAALKSLSSLSMLEIVQLLVHSLKRAAADTSPLVRKTAAHAAAKIYFLDPDQREEIIGILLQLLGDGEIAVAGAALISFRLIFFQSLVGAPPASPAASQGSGQPSPSEAVQQHASDTQEEALALLHPFYARLVALLPQLQPAPQVFAVDLLSRYCRCFFKQPLPPLTEGQQRGGPPGGPQGAPQGGGPNGTKELSPSSLQGLGDGEDSATRSSDRESPPQRGSAVSFLVSRGAGLQQQTRSPPASEGGAKRAAYQPLPEDFERFRQTLELLLLSDSCSVVVSACAAIQALFPAASWDCVVVPLLRCLYTCPSDFKEPLLTVIASFVSVCPRLFQPHMREFYLRQADSFPVRQQKLQLLLSLALSNPSSIPALLPELRVYLHWAGDEQLIASVFRVLTFLALRHKQAQVYCMRLFVSLLDSGSPCVAAEAVVGVRTLVQQKQDEHDGETLTRLVLHLAAQLSKVTSPAARASVVWVLGNYLDQVSWVAADALRQLVRQFAQEAEDVKLQILLLATRLWGFHHHNMHAGPSEADASSSNNSSNSSSSSSSGLAAEGGRQQGAQQRLIPPPTREQSRQHFPRLDSMLRFLFEVATYDSSHDVRDMARTYSALTSALSKNEEDGDAPLSPQERDLRRFAEHYLHRALPSSSSSAAAAAAAGAAPSAASEDAAATAAGTGLWERVGGEPLGEAAWPCSSMAFHSGLVFMGDVPLPAFASVDSDAALRRCLNEEESLRQSFLSLGVRPPQQRGGCGSNSPAPQGGPRSICSADVIRVANAATLMGRTDGGKGPLSQVDLDSFYENDPLADLAHLTGAPSSGNSTECTGTRSSGVTGAVDAGSGDANQEAVWAAFEEGGEQPAAPDSRSNGLHPPALSPPVGLVVGEDEESEEEAAGEDQRLQQTTPANSTCMRQTLKVDDHDADWTFSPTVS